MKIYGTTTSPYVRRLRILLAEQDYTFETLNVFGEDREKLKKVNPTLKIPMFEDQNSGLIFDSGAVYRYLTKKFNWNELTIEQQNILSVIDACNDSLVNMMILTRSDVDVSEDKLFFNIQRERQLESFKFLEQQVKHGTFNQWHYLSISLLVLVEWVQFRNLFDLTAFPELQQFVESNQQQAGVVDSKPHD